MGIIKSIFGIIGKIIFVAVFILMVIFCINNTATVVLSLSPLPFEMETRLCVVIILSLVIGILIGLCFSSMALIKAKFRNFINGWKIKWLTRKVNKAKMAKS